MSKSAKGIEGRRAASAGQLWLRLPGTVREALYETVIEASLACADEVLEAERVALCGERYAHLVDREASRAGHVGPHGEGGDDRGKNRGVPVWHQAPAKSFSHSVSGGFRHR